MNEWRITRQSQGHEARPSGPPDGYTSPQGGYVPSALSTHPGLAEMETLPLPTPSQARQTARKKRIVVIDDSPTICAILKMCFVQAGFEVNAFEDGIAFFRWLLTPEARIPDLLFLDLVLPKMDGYEIARHLQPNPLFDETVLWFMSGKDGTLDQLKGRLVGARGYLTKPFQAKDALVVATTVFKPALINNDIFGKPPFSVKGPITKKRETRCCPF